MIGLDLNDKNIQDCNSMNIKKQKFFESVFTNCNYSE